MKKIPIENINELKAYPLSYRLQKLRWWGDYTQADFAQMLGVKQPSVSSWERGVCAPNGRTLEKIRVIFDLPSDFFIDVDIDKVKFSVKNRCGS